MDDDQIRASKVAFAALCGLVLVAGLLIYATSDDAPPKRGTTAKEAVSEVPTGTAGDAAEKTVPPITPGSQWIYFDSADVMSGKVGRTAYVESKNTFDFNFPYQGKQRARLVLRQHPRRGADVMFMIEKGQLECGYSDCPITVRFDDGKAITYQGNRPADHSTEAVFLPGAQGLIAKIGRAKLVRFEMSVFRQGSIVAEFDVSGLELSRL